MWGYCVESFIMYLGLSVIFIPFALYICGCISDAIDRKKAKVFKMENKDKINEELSKFGLQEDNIEFALNFDIGYGALIYTKGKRFFQVANSKDKGLFVLGVKVREIQIRDILRIEVDWINKKGKKSRVNPKWHSLYKSVNVDHLEVNIVTANDKSMFRLTSYSRKCSLNTILYYDNVDNQNNLEKLDMLSVIEKDRKVLKSK